MALRSLWHDRSGAGTARTASSQPGVDGSWDAVVVGAGITGLTTAVLLARTGHEVLVIEGRRIGSGTTGRSTAKLSLLQGTQLTQIARHHSQDLVRDYVRANLEAQGWVSDFCASRGVELQLRPAYTYATTASGEHAARTELDHAVRAGLAASWTDQVDLPFPTRGAVHLPQQYQVDPVELLQALAEEAASLGVSVVEGARVQRVHGHEPVTVSTSAGTARASRVVVATNTPILDRGGYFARVTAQRSYSLAFRSDVPRVAGMYLSTDEPTRSLRDGVGRDGEPFLLVGGNGHVTGRAHSPRGRLDEIRDWTRDQFGELVETHAWSAQDYQPHHALPYAGPLLPGRGDVLFAGGYSKWGMTNGVAAAHVLAASPDEAPSWARAFATWSPRESRGLLTAARANAEVGLAMTAGWIRPLLSADGSALAEGEGRVHRSGLLPEATSTTDGVLRRVSGVCTHLGGVVGWNDAERSWDCPLHGSRFDADGEVLEGVATRGLAPRESGPQDVASPGAQRG
ncbi:FAD-dependent oxidoreductase [Nocardioides sp.]|uniref:FAD-dependent oxidoreductase n=1 Tax=Nocardioides sp. TaxID=35761 RepID=UPI0026064BD4|nr:FAD-dependent oxidoreductase [Nocardioides sp.]